MGVHNGWAGWDVFHHNSRILLSNPNPKVRSWLQLQQEHEGMLQLSSIGQAVHCAHYLCYNQVSITQLCIALNQLLLVYIIDEFGL
jgi:hypothetical protein